MPFMESDKNGVLGGNLSPLTTVLRSVSLSQKHKREGSDVQDQQGAALQDDTAGVSTFAGLSVEGASRRLASFILDASGIDKTNVIKEHGHESKDEFHIESLRREAAAIAGVGVWAQMELDIDVKKEVNRKLCKDIVANLRCYMSAKDGHFQVFERRTDARKDVFRKALTLKYGSEKTAPSAAMIAGAPHVLYVREALVKSARVEGPGIDWEADLVLRDEWEKLCLGMAVFEDIQIKELQTLRAEIGRALKAAVKAGFSPALVVMGAFPCARLLAGVEVTRALADSYGAHLHVEGPALALLGRSRSNFQYDVQVTQWAHSLLVEPATWYSVNVAAVVLYYCSTQKPTLSQDNADQRVRLTPSSTCDFELDLSRVMVLWYVILRAGLAYAKKILVAATENMMELIDALSPNAHLVETKTIGLGSGMLISPSSLHPLDIRSLETTSLQSHLSSFKSADQFHLSLVTHSLTPHILYSPLLIIKHGTREPPVPKSNVSDLSNLIMSALLRMHMASIARSAFLSRIRACVEIEVADICETGPEPALYFCGIRVVPLGRKSWRRESEDAQLVEKATVALAADLAVLAEHQFEVNLFDEGAYPCVSVGPATPNVEGRYVGGDKDEIKASACRVASIVVEAAKRVLHAIENPVSSQTEQIVDIEVREPDGPSDKLYRSGVLNTSLYTNPDALNSRRRPPEIEILDDTEGDTAAQKDENLVDKNIQGAEETEEEKTDEDMEVPTGFWERLFGSGSSIRRKVKSSEARASDDSEIFGESTDEENLMEDFFRP